MIKKHNAFFAIINSCILSLLAMNCILFPTYKKQGSALVHALQVNPTRDLLMAATHNHVANMKVLMEKPECQYEQFYAMPLRKAATKGFHDIVALILRKFPLQAAHNLDYKAAYYEARIEVVRKKYEHLMCLFLGDIDHRHKNGSTILSHAVQSADSSPAIIEMLLENVHDFTYGKGIKGNPTGSVFRCAQNDTIKHMVYVAEREFYAQKAAQKAYEASCLRNAKEEHKAENKYSALVAFTQHASTYAEACAKTSALKREIAREIEENEHEYRAILETRKTKTPPIPCLTPPPSPLPHVAEHTQSETSDSSFVALAGSSDEEEKYNGDSDDSWITNFFDVGKSSH